VPYGLLVPVAVLAGTAAVLVAGRGGLARPTWVAFAALPIAGVLHGLYMTRSGGDYLHARLILPSLFMVLAPLAALPWRRWLLVPVAVIGVWAVVAAGWLRPELRRTIVPITDYRVADGREIMEGLAGPGNRPLLATDFPRPDGPLARRLQEEGRRDLVSVLTPEPIADVARERTTLVSAASGVDGYRAGPDVYVQESNSLADVVGSRMPVLPNTAPGHRKREPWSWIIARTTRPGVTARQPAAEVEAARRALECGALAALRRATEAPLTASRFASNVWRSYDRTRLVVPREPRAAVREFCG
jgi:arabinofuranosyltransferase